MRFRHPLVDRIWLALVGFAFVVMAPIWFILMGQRFGYTFVSLSLLLAGGHWWYRQQSKR